MRQILTLMEKNPELACLHTLLLPLAIECASAYQSHIEHERLSKEFLDKTTGKMMV